jgi:hypothetical protein
MNHAAATGQALLFIMSLVGLGLFGAGLLAYAAHCFLVIAGQTADGHEPIDWPRSPYLDWILEAAHLGWLVVLWLIPVGFILRALRLDPATSEVLYVLVPVGLFWLFFPVTLLSSFSAGSPWVLLRGEVLRRMARRAPTVLAFYVLSAPLFLIAGAALYAALMRPWFYAVAALAAVLFIYARLVGRLTRLLSRVRLAAARPKGDQGVRRAAKRARVEDPWGAYPGRREAEKPRKKKRKSASRVEDPWAAPKEEAPNLPVEGYGLAREEPPARARREAEARPADGYGVSDEEPARRPAVPPLDGSPPIGEKRTPSGDELPLPPHPLVSGVFTFPWHLNNVGAWGLLTFLLFLWGGLYAFMLSVRPQ